MPIPLQSMFSISIRDQIKDNLLQKTRAHVLDLEEILNALQPESICKKPTVIRS